MTGPSKKTVEVVWTRDQGSCARCGRGLHRDDRGWSWSVHHRAPRGAGGSKAVWINLPSNLILLCGSGTTGCHGRVEKDRAQAENLGFIVRRGVHIPTEIPVAHALYGVVFLTDRGTTNIYPPEETT